MMVENVLHPYFIKFRNWSSERETKERQMKRKGKNNYAERIH